LVTDWPKNVQQEKEYLSALPTEVRTALKKGVFLEDVGATVGLSYKERWKLFDEFHRKNVTKAYTELAWED
jgi:hypothetical protein